MRNEQFLQAFAKLQPRVELASYGDGTIYLHFSDYEGFLKDSYKLSMEEIRQAMSDFRDVLVYIHNGKIVSRDMFRHMSGYSAWFEDKIHRERIAEAQRRAARSYENMRYEYEQTFKWAPSSKGARTARNLAIRYQQECEANYRLARRMLIGPEGA